MDRVGAFLKERTVRRALAIGVFVLLIVLFRQLLPLLVFFVAFERALGGASLFLAQRTRLSRRAALAGLLVVGLGAIAGLAGLGLGRGAHHLASIRDTFPEKI